ncbi:MAG: ATP-binding protein [Bacteroidales bacterium]|nr:ATP-binding protein [Bacteroidales bacterium]
MKLLKRKIDFFLKKWKDDPSKMPLVVKGARQVGKTESITAFAKSNYKSAVIINFALQNEFKAIFSDGYDVDSIIKNISLLKPDLQFPEKETIFFFDEMQECSACATSLKAFKIDGRYDVVCSGSLMGINYSEIESNSVGYKEEYEMRSMDFEEFLWAHGYTDSQIEDLYCKMKNVQPLSDLEMKVFGDKFCDYIITGGMPAVVNEFVHNKNFSGTLKLQKLLLLDYQEDITKYAIGLDKGKVRNAFNHIAVFLAKENKKFQITKIARNARSRDYIGVVDWLQDAGIINVCYCLDTLALPLKGNYNPSVYKIYFQDTGLLTASLDDEAQYDLRANRNFNTYKGAIYENIVGDMLVKQDYDLYFYKNEKSTIEMDFFVRDASSLIPIEVKASDNSTKSLNKLTDNEKYPEIKYGIKFCNKNIGFNGKFYTFPYFLAFLLRRFLNS